MPKRTCKTTISLDKDVKARLVGLFESSEEGFKDWNTSLSELLDYLEALTPKDN